MVLGAASRASLRRIGGGDFPQARRHACQCVHFLTWQRQQDGVSDRGGTPIQHHPDRQRILIQHATGLARWEELREQYSRDEFEVKIRDKVTRNSLYSESLAGLKIPKIALPNFDSLAETLKWLRKEHLPGYFPYTAGVFQFRREGEDPKRQFAGEGPPERTNARFHYLTKDDDAKRLSTAFDSLTLYGEDPTEEPELLIRLRAVEAARDIRQRRTGLDVYRLRRRAHSHIEIKAERILHVKNHVRLDQLFESRFLDLDAIESGRQMR